MAGKSLHGGPERPLYETVEAKPGLDPRIFEAPELWDVFQGELQTGSGTSPAERRVLQPAQLEGWYHLHFQLWI